MIFTVVRAKAWRKSRSKCKSIKAKISPHFRPEAWHDSKLFTHMSRPVRITGQLFYDHSHAPCKNGQKVGTHPPRISCWEIHPVYAIDVCKKTKLKSCGVNNESVWRPLHEWTQEELLMDEEEDVE